jgi:hypothetical protein
MKSSQQSPAVLSRFQDGALFNIAGTSRGANGISFGKATKNRWTLLKRESHVTAKRFGLWFSESLVALLAFPTLHFFRSVKSCLHHLGSALVARHFGLAFFGP